MRFRNFSLLLAVLVVVLILSGCRDKEAPPKLDAQKNVVHTYLEGLRDHNKDKIYQTVDVGLKIKTMDPDFKKSFESFDQSVGQIKSWVLEDKGSWIDEVNNQALIKVKLSTSKKKVLPLDVDLRKYDNRWVVYSVRISESGKMDQDKAYFNNPHNKTDKTNKTDNTNKTGNTKNTDTPKNK